ncbi:MAG: LEA type 2 family protein [Thermoanaerobaculaceae bacterium]|nr:LEA type 2 family protein [Thermoanaerobaculaceae bacterium]
MSDPGEVEAEGSAAPQASPDTLSNPKLDRVLCRTSWCLAAFLGFLLLTAALLRVGAVHWAGRLAEARVVDLQLARAAGEQASLLATVRIEVTNRTPIPFSLNGLQYTLGVGTVEVHRGEWKPEVPVRLGAFGTTSLELQALLEPSRLVGAVLQVLAGDRPTARIRARLRLGTWLGPITVPVTIQGSLPSGGIAAATTDEGRR